MEQFITTSTPPVYQEYFKTTQHKKVNKLFKKYILRSYYVA